MNKLPVLVQKKTNEYAWVMSLDFQQPFSSAVHALLYELLTKADGGSLGRLDFQLHAERGQILILIYDHQTSKTDVEAFVKHLATQFRLEPEILHTPLVDVTAKVKFIYPESKSPVLIVRLPNNLSEQAHNFATGTFFAALKIFGELSGSRDIKLWKVVVGYRRDAYYAPITATRQAVNTIFEHWTEETGIKILYSEEPPSGEDMVDSVESKLFPGY
jgi:hypothetical protein